MSPRSMTLSLEQKRLEVGQIARSTEYLADFAEYVSYGQYTAHSMHKLMAREARRVVRYLETDGAEGTQFLMVLTPPQHGKSTLISRYLPAFALGKLPNLRTLLISYGADLATRDSRAVRNMILTDRYQSVFGIGAPSGDEPVELASDSKSAAAWDLADPHRGGMIAAGVDGAVSGQAKGLGIFDDPIKNEKEAQSAGVRQAAWEFYVSSLRVRMDAGVLVMTHWHPDDPAGRIIRNMITTPDGDKWRILMLPGLIEEGMFATDREDQRKRMLDGVYLPLRDPLGRSIGEVLCPERLKKSEMLKIRALDERNFQALYQQSPYAKAGTRYKKEWFKKVKRIPEGVRILHILRCWDKASTTDGNYTVGVLMAYCSDGKFYILDVVRGRWTTFERDQMILKTAKRDREIYGPTVQIWHPQDPGAGGIDGALGTQRTLRGFAAFFEPVTGSKEDRSEPLESGVQGQMVFLIEAVWNDIFIDELVAFPRGKFDDQVDGASGAYNKLNDLIDEPPPPPEDEIVFYEERVNISPM